MDSEEEVAPILANFRRYNDFSIEDEILFKVQRGPRRAIRNVPQGILGLFVRTWRLQATTKKVSD